MKVTFKDTSATQYDANADLVDFKALGLSSSAPLGKLYVGDRYSAAFLQLKFRKCKHVIICDKEIFSLGREEDITYLNIDPSDDIPENWSKVYDFIEKAIINSNNITILCQSGNAKSAVIVAYYIMRRLSISPFAAVEKLKGFRSQVRISPSLNALLSREAKKLGLLSTSIPGQKEGGSGMKSRTMGIIFVSVVVLFFAVLYFALDSASKTSVIPSRAGPPTTRTTTRPTTGSKHSSKSRRKSGSSRK